jgi:DNA-binding winged helix-turn-helix (wHTH) protein
MAKDSDENDEELKVIGLSYEFGPFRLVPAERRLLRAGRALTLPPKAFDTLLILVQRHGHVVKKDDLLKMVWPETFVEENNLNQYISLLRRTLTNGTTGDGYIETVRRYGYRFTAKVREMRDERSALLVHRRSRARALFSKKNR